MTDFYPIVTDDGSLSLYNNEVGDVYHSVIGAYKESLEKFVFPSGLLDFVKTNNEVTILDICYGMGYNSFAAIEEIQKVNPKCKINIYALEYDVSVLAFSTLLSFEKVKSNFVESIKSCLLAFDEIRLENINLAKKHNILPIDLSVKAKSGTFVHNIYYRTLSNRISLGSKTVKIPEIHAKINNNINFHLFIADARNSIQLIDNYFDYIFHDSFTPSKLPTLWTVDFFKRLEGLLNINGNLSTYSAASPVRAGLIEAGFYLGKTLPVGRKNCCTIAYKNKNLINIPLEDHELGILSTNAGVPYYDQNLDANTESILKNRKELQNIAGRQSSSSYFKNLKKRDSN